MITEAQLANDLLIEYIAAGRDVSNALVYFAISPYSFRSPSQQERVVESKHIPEIKATIDRELTAKEWIKSNPISALKVIRQSAPTSSVLSVIDVALLVLAQGYDKWYDAMNPTDDRRPYVQGRSKEAKSIATAL